VVKQLTFGDEPAGTVAPAKQWTGYEIEREPDVVFLDGSHEYIGSPRRVRCVVKADLRSVSVAAASVIAKVTRDRRTSRRPSPASARPRITGCPGPT
jgi:hypothetical protein